MADKRLFTSESVTEGHPDKLCDQVSDGVLDAVLAQDPMARVACETCTTTGVVMVMGEMTTTANISVEEIVRETVKKIGYDGSGESFDYKTCAVLTALHGRFKKVAIETNGTRDVISGFNLITISPKDCFVENAALATQTSGAEMECKVVFDGEHNPEQYFERVPASHYYLQPCDTGDPARNAEILAAAVQHIKTHPWWRLSLQTQKIIKAR